MCEALNKQNVIRGWSSAIGKSWLACALAQKACRDGFSVLHKRASELFRELAVAHADGSIGRFLVRLSRIDILLLDDFAMAPLKDAERRDFLEICDDRYQRRSMILTSQMPVAHWHEQIGDPTIADSILDRLIHHAYRIELKGESLRKKTAPTGRGRITMIAILQSPASPLPFIATFQNGPRRPGSASAAQKPRALDRSGPFRTLTSDKGKGANAKVDRFLVHRPVPPPAGRPRPIALSPLTCSQDAKIRPPPLE